MSQEMLWVRKGDKAEYESFDGIEETDFNECFTEGVEVTGWVKHGFIASLNFDGHNYVSCYWGDKDATPMRELSDDERQLVERLVLENQKRYAPHP